MSASTRSLRRDPLRLLFSAAPWSAAWYLFGYLFVGTALFAIALAAATVGFALSFTLAGLPLLVAAAATIRWCADAERLRLRAVLGELARGRYREPASGGVMARLRTRWRDAATWRDLAYLVGLYVPLLVLDAVVLSIWLNLLAGITLPAWYQYPKQTWQVGSGAPGSAPPPGYSHGAQLGYFPHGPHGHPAWGLYVDTLPKAFAVAAVCLVLFIAFNYVLVAASRLHANTARTLLVAHEDPLGEAKEVLGNPGPLQKFITPDSPVAPPPA